MGMVMGRTILQMDEPEHRAVRALVAVELPLQDARALGGGPRRPRGQRADRHLHRRAGAPTSCATVTFNFPVQVIARILGLPRADYPMFQRWAIELTSVAANWDRGRGRLGGPARLLRRRHGRAPR